LADRILSFDSTTGVLHAEAGLSIEEIQRLFLPRNWSFPVLPGTQYVTLGGAVAADIHGKNHHVDGTVGNQFIEALAEAARKWPYTVGWMDALARGDDLGRGILMRGRWAEAGEAPTKLPQPKRRLTVPFPFPGWVLNSFSMRAFNAFYFHKHPQRTKRGIVHPESFFHPLDAIQRWNLVYGRRGFTQHQCVLPEEQRPGSTKRYLESLTAGGLASFLCVIKDCGPEGEGLLSFPCPGISIAVDLPMRRHTQAVVNELNERVLEAGGRIYLAKDALSTPEHFRAMENRLEEFQSIRRRWDPEGRLRSAQSVRLLGDRA
jgi:FAD/FMN-containing dehydrogenase